MPKLPVGLIHRRTADGFGHGFAAVPGAEKVAPSLRQIWHSQPAQQRGHIHVVANAFDVDSNGDTARDGDHCPKAGVREAEFDITAGFESGLAVRAESEPNLRGWNACVICQDGSQRGSRANPAAAIGLKAKARGTKFFVG